MDDFQHQGGPSGRVAQNGIPEQAHRATRLRVPTVSEALPFTPFSSIVPFDPNIIPAPLTLAPPSIDTFPPTQDALNARVVLDQLCAGATRAQDASDRCKQTLHDVQKLLDPQSLTKYTFRTPKNNYKPSRTSPTSTMRATALSPFAKMVYDSLGAAKDDDTVVVRHAPQKSVKKDQDVKKSATPQPRPKQSAQPKAQVMVEVPMQVSKPTKSLPRPPQTSPKGSQAFIMPKPMSQEERAQYQYIEVPEDDNIVVGQTLAQAINGAAVAANGQRPATNDQRHKADAAVQNLQNMFSDLFEAEDRLQADTSGKAVIGASSLFAIRDTDDGSVPVLHLEAQVKLDSAINKVTSSGRIDDLDIDDLQRVQSICERALLALDSGSLQIEEDWTEQDEEEWVVRIVNAERGLMSARTLLRIMGAGAHLKKLQSEDYLSEIMSSFRAVIENFLVPLVEQRSTTYEKTRGDKEEPPANPKFTVATAHRKQLQTLLNATTKAYRALGTFLSKNDVDESTLSSVAYFCKMLIFADNAAVEKDSALGIQNFENTRKCAMDVLTAIYVKYTEQRQYIVDEILTSLEKLPATKQSARQFRLNDCKPIQLVSALLMRLVQTSATYGGDSVQAKVKIAKTKVEDSEASEDESEEESEEEDSEDEAPRKKAAPAGLMPIAKPLYDAAHTNASYIVRFLIQRALTTSKSSDEPYRRLLDIFTQDFLEVLGSSDWPGAEMLLRTLVIHLISLAEGAKSAAAARVMALELLGTIGSGILQLQTVARNGVKGLESSSSVLAAQLIAAVGQCEAGGLEIKSLVDFDGPYRLVVEYLQARGDDDPQLLSALGYHLMQWAMLVLNAREEAGDEDSLNTDLLKDLQKKLRHMIVDSLWLGENYDYPAIGTKEGRLAAIVVILSSKLCKAFDRIFSILLNSMKSEQPTIRSRALKSVSALLETDPSILDRSAFILKHISHCATDPSSLVRASAVGLFEKCTTLRPSLDDQVYDRIISRTRDAAPSVRKSALALLTRFYLRNESTAMRAAIASAIIARIDDSDDSIQDLARNTMEQIWFQPLHRLKIEGDGAFQTKIDYNAQAALLIHTVRMGDNVVKVLESLVKELLTKSKAAMANSHVCKTLIGVMFDGVIDNSDLPGSPTQQDILLCLTIFAKACPKLVTAAQIERLEPYTQSLNKDDDLEVYRSAISILRHTLPFQSTLRNDFLANLQTALMQGVPRLQEAELAEVVSCLWTINSMLGNVERLVNFLLSVLNNIYNIRSKDFKADPATAKKLGRLVLIAGHLGRACDLDDQLAQFKSRMPWFKGNSVSGLIVEILCPFTSPRQPLEVREVSLEAICTVAQDWPKLYLRADVVNAFEIVFQEQESSLEEVLLSGLEAFYRLEDSLKGAEEVPELGTGVASGTERLGRTYVATDRDGASTSLAQRFLPQILRLALSSLQEKAFIAAKLVVSINKHSLVLPKLSAPALVALETCPNQSIANLAFSEHKEQHTKRESLFEKEYMRAIDQAFRYQQDVNNSPQGHTGSPPTSKMHLMWEVLKTGKAQGRKKFLGNWAQKLDFDAQDGASSDHAALVRYSCENLALFDYDKVDDLVHLLTCLDKTFSGSGTAIAQAVESEVLSLRVDTLPQLQQDGVAPAESIEVASTVPAISPERLLQLATSAQTLAVIWETRSFIHRVWNMQKQMERAKAASKDKAKAKEKDINRAPIRSTQAPGLTDAYLGRIKKIMEALETTEGQRSICGVFVETISVDSEVKPASDGDEDEVMENNFDTPSEGTGGSRSPSAAPGSGRGKKRKLSTAGATPRKRGRPSNGRRRSSTMDDDDEEGGWD